MLLPVLAITAFGLGLSITAVSPARWAGDLCADYESGVRSITLAFTAGMLVFGPLPGLLADWLGAMSRPTPPSSPCCWPPI